MVRYSHLLLLFLFPVQHCSVPCVYIFFRHCSFPCVYSFVLHCSVPCVYSQNTEMWRDFNKIGDVVQAASVWLLTLEKQGCSTMLQAGTVLHLFHLCCPHMWSRNKINSVLATIYFISAPGVRTCKAEIK